MNAKVMNVVILNDYATVQGGASQVAIQSARGLVAHGHQVHFVYAAGIPDKVLIHPRIILYRLGDFDLLNNPSRINAAIKGIWDNKIYKDISSLLAELSSIDTVIHVHTWVKGLSISAVSAILRYNFPVFLTLHDYFVACPNGGFFNFQSTQICELKPMSAACISTNCDQRAYHHKIWRVLRQATYLFVNFPSRKINYIAVSDFSKRILIRYLPSNSSIALLRNPVKTDSGGVTDPSKSDTILFVGRFSVEKGVGLLSELKGIPSSRFLFVGSGDLSESLKNAFPHARFVDWVEGDALFKLIRSARFIVFPSLWYETQGLVVAEAASCGIPSIVSDACAATDFVVNEFSGLYFESGSAKSLLRQIDLLDSSDNYVRYLGLNAYNYFWNNPPTLERHVDDLIFAYAGALTAK